jgi:hypothetical protein
MQNDIHTEMHVECALQQDAVARLQDLHLAVEPENLI